MSDTTVYDIATKYDIVEGAPNRTLESAILIMGTKKFRRLPITKLGKIRGILTVTDIIRAIARKGLPEAFDEEISDWMTAIPKTIEPDATILTAIKKMHEGNFGSLLIVDEGSEILKAIITERDILMHYKDYKWDQTLANIDPSLLKSGLVKINHKISLEEAIIKMNNNQTHRVLTFNNDTLVGILTANDITSMCSKYREEISQNPNFLKSIDANFVSTKNVETVKLDSSLTKVITFMCSKGIGSVPILQDNKVIGLFSERTLIHLLAKEQ